MNAEQPPFSNEYHHDYPPQPHASSLNSNKESHDEDNSGWGSTEKGINTVTRGSMAAQMAAEGQIPKKEGLRMWRTDEHAGALMKGGRGRCCGRVCGCSIILVLILLISIVSSFFLFVRPPSVTFNGVEPPSTGSQVSLLSNGFLLNLDLNIGVVNPNFFGANFDTIAADAYYSSAPTVPFGGGSLSGVEIPKNSRSTIHFPFTLNYTTAIDPNLTILRDIATKCGFLGNTISQLTVNYTIKLALKVVGITITPQFSSSTSFDCPIKESDISGLLGAGGLAGLGAGKSSRRSLTPEQNEQAAQAISKVMKRGLELTKWE